VRREVTASGFDLAAILARVAPFVAALGAPYAVIGGAAMVARVRVRPTRDCDLVLKTGRTVDEVLAIARAHGLSFQDNATMRSLADAGLIQLQVTAPESGTAIGSVDLIMSDSPFLDIVLARAQSVELGAVRLNVATLEDLLLLKLDANRPIDLDDAIAIKDAFGKELDRAYLAEQAGPLGLRERVENLLGEALPEKTPR
jgi:hypothetical protein